MTDWIDWLKEVRYAKKSRGKAPVSELAKVAKTARVKVPKSELTLVKTIGALRQSETVLPASTPWQSLFQPERGVALEDYARVFDAARKRRDKAIAKAKSGKVEPGIYGFVAPTPEPLTGVSAAGEPLRAVVCSFQTHPPYLFGTDQVPGWGWFFQAKRFRNDPSSFPVATNLEDLALQSWAGLARYAFTFKLAKYELNELRRWQPEDDAERQLVQHAIERLRECAETFSECDHISVDGRTLADGCAIVLKNLKRIESTLFGTKKKANRKKSLWPDAELTDEDELAAAVCAAYSPGKHTMKSLRKLLERGGRHRAPKKLSFGKGVPKLLRDFVAECKPPKRGMLLEPGVPFYADDGEELDDGPWFMVFTVGNGDFWVCNRARSSVAHYVDHEGGTHFVDDTGLPLGSLLAAWLFNDEITARGLVDHPECEARARELCPVEGAWSVFPDTL